MALWTLCSQHRMMCRAAKILTSMHHDWSQGSLCRYTHTQTPAWTCTCTCQLTGMDCVL
jgi:hypothetical protein